MVKILVTAVGSELAVSVVKAAKLLQQPFKLIGCDIYPEVAGKYWCDNFYNVPLAKEEEAYISALIKIVEEEQVNIIIPTADIEFFILSKYKVRFRNNYNCNILINDYDEIVRFNDKWLAYQWYIENKLPTPKSFLADHLDKLQNDLRGFEYPLFLKPRVGGGSRTIFKVKSFEEIVKFQPIVPNPIVQEYLFPDNEEFTAGTYRTAGNDVFVIVLKRTLKFGMTYTAEVVFNDVFEDFAKQIILHTNLKGSNNIQFRVTKEGPKILEINPRFSGTTGIRANFGFNDVEMWVNETLFAKKIMSPEIKKGFVLRHMEEQYHFNQ